jgi:biopolymer transport protein ExbD
MKITRKKSRADVPSMAMGDIAFNLLIFFVILARSQDDSHLQWQPATSVELESAGHSKASVLVDKDGKTYLNGQPTSIGQLETLIDGILTDSPPGDRTVLLKIHADTVAQQYEAIFEAVSKSGGELVHVVDEEK